MAKARTERWAVEALGLTKANPTKTISAQSASPGYLPKIEGNKGGNLREAKPSAMTATTYTSSHNLLRDVPIDVIQKLAPNDKLQARVALNESPASACWATPSENLHNKAV